jgi:hypothetical protein
VIKLRKIKIVGYVALVGNKSTCRVFVGKPERNRPLARPRLRWEDNIKVELKGMEWGATDCFYLAQGTEKWRAPLEKLKPLPVA